MVEEKVLKAVVIGITALFHFILLLIIAAGYPEISAIALIGFLIYGSLHLLGFTRKPNDDEKFILNLLTSNEFRILLRKLEIVTVILYVIVMNAAGVTWLTQAVILASLWLLLIITELDINKNKK